MDVSCDRCRTVHELDDARVTEAGVTVKCAVCGHVFKLRKKTVVVTESWSGFDASAAVPSEDRRERAGTRDSVEGASSQAPSDEDPQSRLLSAPIADLEPDDADLRAIRGGGSARFMIGLVVAAMALGATIFYLTTRQASPTRAALSQVPIPAASPRDSAPAPVAPAPVPEVTPEERAAKPKEPVSKPDGTGEKGIAAMPAKPAGVTGAADARATPAESKPAPAAEGAGAKSFDAYLQEAFRLREHNQAKRALSYYEKAAELQPDNVEAIAGKAFCLVDLGRYDEAVVLFRQALTRHPRYLEAIMGLAETYKEKGDNGRAVEYYKRYLEEAPSGPEASIAKTNIDRLSP